MPRRSASPPKHASRRSTRLAGGPSTSSASASDREDIGTGAVATAVATDVRTNGSAHMLNRRDVGAAGNGVRGKMMEDQHELEEMGYGRPGEEREAFLGKGGDLKRDGKDEAKAGPLSARDRNAIALLVVLYLLQGIPVGLAFGSVPFLLKSQLSYSEIGVFTLCTYPYSLKLLWSPIVDSCFVNSVRVPGTGGRRLSLGRRKSWIVPIQFCVGCMMWWLGRNIENLMFTNQPPVRLLTAIFFILVFLAATQDIAVDGWALTLLSQDNLSYASTAQTIGLNTGYFLSFTVFLAFNSVEFSNSYFRSTPLEYPLLSLGGYLRFWALAYFAVTAWLVFGKKEDPTSSDDPDMDIKGVYSIMYSICKLKHVQSFIAVHLVSKIGFQANDAVTGLKLLEKGFSKEDLALAVLIDFPFQLVFGYLAAKWSKGERPLRPWIAAFAARLGFAVVAMGIVKGVPEGGQIGKGFFMAVIASMVLASFTSTVQFVGISAFHTQIADPLIGGTYMTLLNTVSNLGGTWPRYFVLKAVDYFTKSQCRLENGTEPMLIQDTSGCISEHGKQLCTAAGGTCVVERDGYYITSTICVVMGAAILALFIIPTARKLELLPSAAWRVKISSS